MKCPKCGAEMPNDSVFCAQCGASTAEPTMANNPQQVPPQYAYSAPAQQSPINGEAPINGTTYLVFAIIATVICCLPFGIPAIISATKIDKAQAAGDFMGAKEAAKKAKMWTIISAAAMGVFAILYVILIVLGVAAGIGGY